VGGVDERIVWATDEDHVRVESKCLIPEIIGKEKSSEDIAVVVVEF